MGRLVLLSAALLGVAAVGFFAFAPGIAERGMNRNTGASWRVSAAARALHARLSIADLHADTLMWKRDLLSETTDGHVDLKRLEAGNVALQVFSSVTKTPRGQNYERNSGDTDNITPLVIAQAQPVRTWISLLERSLWHAEKLHDAAARANGRLRVIKTASDLAQLLADRAAGKQVTGALLSTEAGRIWKAASPMWRSCTMPVSACWGWRISLITNWPDRWRARRRAGSPRWGRKWCARPKGAASSSMSPTPAPPPMPMC